MRRLRQNSDENCTIGMSAMIMFITAILLAAIIHYYWLTEGIVDSQYRRGCKTRCR